MRNYLSVVPMLLLAVWFLPSENASAQNWSNFSTPNESFNDEYYDSDVTDDARYQYSNTRYSGYTPYHNKLVAPWFADSPKDPDWKVGGAWRSDNYWHTADYAEPVPAYGSRYYQSTVIRYPLRTYAAPVYNPPRPYPLHPSAFD